MLGRTENYLIRRGIFYTDYIYKPWLMQDLAKSVADYTDNTHFCIQQWLSIAWEWRIFNKESPIKRSHLYDNVDTYTLIWVWTSQKILMSQLFNLSNTRAAFPFFRVKVYALPLECDWKYLRNL